MNKPFLTPIDVIFHDIDAMGHVNNAIYFTYMETARTQLFMEALQLTNPSDLPVIVAEARCNYLSPARFGDELIIATTVCRIGKRSFDLCYEITTKNGQPVAFGSTVMVTFDYQERKVINIPSNLMSILETYYKTQEESEQRNG